MLLALAAPAWAQTESPTAGQSRVQAAGERFFEQGVAAFRQRDYDRARQYFELALDAGMTDAALHYNLGVTYYKLGEYELAGQHFLVAGGDPQWAPLAFYNSGLVANKQGNEEAARRWFERALTVAQDTRLQAMAATMLDRLGGARPASRWNGFAMVNLGYDDNVALSADGEVIVGTGEADQFAELYGQANWEASGKLKGLGAYAGLYLLKYKDLDDFDIADLNLAANWGTPVANWYATVEGRFEYLWQGGTSVQRILTLAAESYPTTGVLQPLLLGYELSRIDDEDPAYAPLNGWRHRVLAQYRQQVQRWRLRYGYLFEYNDRQDLDLGTDFFSESPVRNALRVRAALPLPGNWQTSARLEYRRSDFRDPDRRADGTEATRRDNRWDFTLDLTWIFTRPWELGISYNRTDNSSNFDEFDYTRNLYFIGVARPF
ncbi:MAG: tetratricopeptide repeat protein [Pseudomonadota bacterium]|nr:MAG: tetratricopeptide repeat protein [Pseudomonadota bacterium]